MEYKLTRIAPTPSGYLHLGNVFSFAVTAALARRSGAEILLRIDDLDRERVQHDYVEDIFETLRFMGIPWDRGPRSPEDLGRSWSQVYRMPMYREALSQLRTAGAVFGCSCSRAEVVRVSRDGGYPGTCLTRGLDPDGEGMSWRLRMPADETGAAMGPGESNDATAGTEILRVRTYTGGSIAARLPVEMRNFVVRKKDEFPAYQLSSVVDDMYYGVDLIVRGQDLWASTLAQFYLSYPLGATGFRDVRFYHHLLLMTGTGDKLSKSAGAGSIRYLRQRGLGAAAIYAMIAQEVVRAGDVGGPGGAARPFPGEPGRSEVHDWEGLAALVLDID